MKRLLYGAVTALAVCGALTLASCGGGSSKDVTVDEWQLVWEEDFDGETFDTTVWTKIPRGRVDWNNTMSDYDSLYEVADGNLILRCQVNRPEETGDSVPYITGGLYTLGKKAFRNGRIEICARLGEAKGAWPAFWLLPDTTGVTDKTECSWPKGGEIDIMEHLSFDSVAYQTVHSYYTYTLGNDSVPRHGATGPIQRGEYNIYAVELGPDSIRFFINDYNTLNYPRTDADPAMGQYPYDKPMYLLLDMQLGGSWVGEVDPNDLPVEMMIDWVRFYQKGQGGK